MCDLGILTSKLILPFPVIKYQLTPLLTKQLIYLFKEEEAWTDKVR